MENTENCGCRADRWGFRGIPVMKWGVFSPFFIVGDSPDKVPDSGTVSDHDGYAAQNR
jgi:hypothetical protein